ncbi:hypothetical protein FLK61_37345 [Paenalkalicoccus suaedae]|uniref:Uncharacterized protein n=1 Tax=Paenalkalicoccus suaedae TaxID=2592382 RepID=A0A859FG12_9BACI|nr:hypothetical protein [Paenalkalicoccus suaedae]QKS72303.1 hypothetical protein FLK61_37345 [Paenalkalicoccus suaedae]
MFDHMSDGMALSILLEVLVVGGIWFLIFLGIIYATTTFVPYGFIIIQFLFLFTLLLFTNTLIQSPLTLSFEDIPIVWYSTSFIVLYVHMHRNK